MELGQKQETFSLLLARLILWAYSKGYKIRMGEVWRTPEQAELNSKTGKGIKNSLHLKKLAADLNVFKDNVWLQKSEDLKPLGDYWKKLGQEISVPTAWGGDFKKPDGNHFSIEDGGVR